MTLPDHKKADNRLLEWQEKGWLLIALATPLSVNFWVEQQFEASKIWLLRTLIWIVAALWINDQIRKQSAQPIQPVVNKFLIVLACILLLSTVLSPNRYIAFFGTLDRANGVLTQLSYLLLFFCVATGLNAERSKRLLHAIILTAVPICLLALAQAAGWQPLPLLTDGRTSLTTTLGRSNFTGAYLALLLPLTLSAAQLAGVRWKSASYTMLFTLELIVIALTQARAAWVAAIAGVSIFFWLQFAPRWSFRIQLVTALSWVVGLLSGLFYFLQQGVNGGGSIAARWTIWQASLQLLWPRLWLGYGADSLELYFPSVYPPQLVYYQGRGVMVDRAHNWLLDWSLNYGVVATVVLIGFVFFVLKQGWQQLTTPQRANTRLNNRWVVACMGTICAQLIGNLFLFEVAATAVVFWLSLAIVIATTARVESPTSSIHIPVYVKNAVMIISPFIVVLAIWQWNMRPFIADLHSWRGTQALSNNEASTALAAYEKGVRYQPMRATYHVATALTAAQLDDLEQAEESMYQAIALRPTDPFLYTHLASIHLHRSNESSEDARSAFGAYERAINLAPTIALIYQQYADAALRSGDIPLALRGAQQAVNLDATDGVSFGILGWAQLQSGNLDQAFDAFEQAVKWQPDSADFHLGLATVYAQQGDLDAARRSLEEALKLDPTYPAALTLKVQLQE